MPPPRRPSPVEPSLETYARLAVALGRRPLLSFPGRAAADTNDRSRTGRDLVHAAMGEIEARKLAANGYQVALDEPYQHYQFAGRADLLAWDLEARALLHLENKSRLADLQDVAGSYNAKRPYLPAVLGDRLGVGPRGWATVTHALVVLWSSEVLHVLRVRAATFRALCPSPIDPFEAWWSGSPPPAGARSSLVMLDPSPVLVVPQPALRGPRAGARPRGALPRLRCGGGVARPLSRLPAGPFRMMRTGPGPNRLEKRGPGRRLAFPSVDGVCALGADAAPADPMARSRCHCSDHPEFGGSGGGSGGSGGAPAGRAVTER